MSIRFPLTFLNPAPPSPSRALSFGGQSGDGLGGIAKAALLVERGISFQYLTKDQLRNSCGRESAVPDNLFDLSGKVALVTGANSGLGFACARAR